jgi:hypothetical protein
VTYASPRSSTRSNGPAGMKVQLEERIQRPPPSNSEAEQRVLGAILVDNDVFHRVDFLGAETFANALHGRIFESIAQLISAGEVANPVTMKNLFDGDSALEGNGGGQYLVQLAKAGALITNVEDYAKALVDLAARRAFIRLCEDSAEDAYLPTIKRPVEVLLARHQDHLTEIANGTSRPNGVDPDYVRERVSLDFWHKREIPPVNPILGELVTTTSRIMVVGPTGLGKTNLLMAAAIAMADGADFLHWHGCGRPRCVLYIDGEMSRRLFKERLDDAVRRHGRRPTTFFAFSREDFPDMTPLDTTEGQKFVDRIIEALGSVDLVIFDNVQALTIGELREPDSWRKIVPWARSLTKRKIGQVWVHHTGFAENRAYGDKSREWQLDTVVLMETAERPDADIAFRMKFTKARERTPQNHADFEPVIITLERDRWLFENAEKEKPEKAVPPSEPKPPSPLAVKFYNCLTGAIIVGGKCCPQSMGRPAVSEEQWAAELTRLGLIEKEPANKRRALISKYKRELLAANWIACNHGLIWNVKNN